MLLKRAIMSPRNEVLTAIPFEISYEANKPLIPAGDAEEEEDHRLEEEAFFSCNISALLLGLLVGFLISFSIMGTKLLVITLSGEDLITKSTTHIVVFSLLWGLFTAATAIASLGFLRNLVTITYSAVGERSNDMLEKMVWRMECRFFVSACLAWTMTDVLWGMWAQPVHSLVMLAVALLWTSKNVVMCSATDSKPSLVCRSSAEETIPAI
jgi:hypothetical protein